MSLTLLLAVTLVAAASGAKTKTTKTKLDIRVVRSPQHQHTDTASSYVLRSHQQHARSEEGQSEEQQPEEHHHAVNLVSEEQYEALLKQAQKALQGYDLTKLSAAAHQVSMAHQSAMAHHVAAAPIIKEHRAPTVVYKPEVQIKYVYADTPKSVAYNTAPAAYSASSYTHDTSSSSDEHDNGYDHYSKHKFGYRVHDPHTGAAFGHSEVSEGHVTRGHYHVLLPDGRLQNVKYTADPSGYHATVTYENYKNYH